MNTIDTIQAPPAARKKHTLTLLVAIFFFVTAIIPLFLLFKPTPTMDNIDIPAGTLLNETETYMTPEQKIDEVAKKLENVFYPPYKESTFESEEVTLAKEANRREFFTIGTWVTFAALVASSLFMGAAFLLMYLSPGLSFNIRSTIMLICVILAVVGALIMAIMHIYSIIVLVRRIPTINTNINLVDQKAKDSCTTESVYYILRSILATAGLGYYIYTLPSFAFNSEINKKKKKKLARKAKSLYAGYTSAALVCTYYAAAIALTWTFNFTTKALLTILTVCAIGSYLMIGYVYNFHNNLKKVIAKESTQTVPSTETVAV